MISIHKMSVSKIVRWLKGAADQVGIPRWCIIISEQFTVKAKEPLILTWLYKKVASMEDAIFNCQCEQVKNCQGGCETIYKLMSIVPNFLPSNLIGIL